MFSFFNPFSGTKALPTAENIPPIVYTIAGSDSGGGAGIQADLHAIHGMECHGCSAIASITAQNSEKVTKVYSPPPSVLKSQLEALEQDLYPRAIKIGMLSEPSVIHEVGKFIKYIKEGKEHPNEESVFVVVDPVMISTSGVRLLERKAQKDMVQKIFPYADVLTPNIFEAEELLKRKLLTTADVEQGARDLLSTGVQSVLIKGGHTLRPQLMKDQGKGQSDTLDVNATFGFAQDYFLSKGGSTDRICDGARGVWIRSPRYETENTHGTGCTLSSAIASAFALGHQQRERFEKVAAGTHSSGAFRAIQAVDACCLAKAYVTAGIGLGVKLGTGPGPVVHTHFPSTHKHYPSIVLEPTKTRPAFLPMVSTRQSAAGKGDHDCAILGQILPVVSTREWVKRLCETPGITDIQLRIKDPTISSNTTAVQEIIQHSQYLCSGFGGIRLWINDYWEEAISCEEKPFGIHLGQEDLTKCIEKGGLDRIRSAGMALGISTHSFGELSVALGIKPTYISLGPIYDTTSKNVIFEAQGVNTVRKWRELIGEDIPLVGIGGIDNVEKVRDVKDAGLDCVAVIGAIEKASNLEGITKKFIEAME